MNAPASVHFELLVSRNSIREGVRDALRLHAGRGRRYSVAELSQGSGVPEGNIENAMRPVDNENFRPLKLEEQASIAKFLGASFVSAYLDLSDLGAFELSGQAPLPKVLATAESQPDIAEERKRLIRRLAELEGVQ
jgi:hypothetical protein